MANYTDNLGLYKWQKTDPKITTIEEMEKTMVKIDSSLAEITNYVYVKKYGATGDGVTDDTAAIQSAISYMETNNLKGYLVFGDGTFKHTGFTISKAGIGIIGENATLYGGTVKVWGAERTANTAIPDFNFRCKNIEFLADTNTINLLSFKNARIIDLDECVFRNGDKAIVFEQSNYAQHCNRIIISDCRFHKPNYAIYINDVVQDAAMLDVSWAVGDIQILNSQFFLPNITHIYAKKLDGIVMNGNTLFFDVASNTIQSHLDIYKLNWGIITNNNFFASGYESIKIGQLKGVNIANNVFVWSGLRQPSSAIKLYDGDSSASTNCSSVVSGNVIYDATKHGIEIAANCLNILVALNNIRDVGVGQYYHGVTDLTTITHYSIDQPNSTDSLLLGNMSSGYDINSLIRPSALSIGNITKSRDKKASKPQSTIDNAQIVSGVVDVKDNELFYISLSTAAASIDNFTGYTGQEITLFRIGANDVTINHNTAKIRTKTKANVVLTSGDTMKLQNVAGVWWQV